MPSVTFVTPEVLIDRLEAAVLSEWERGDRAFGRTRDAITDAGPDGWCVVGSPGCSVAVSREPFSLWINPFETRLVEWPPEHLTRARPSVARLTEMMAELTEELFTIAISHLVPGGDPEAHARRWLRMVDWSLAEVDSGLATKAQLLLDRWRGHLSPEKLVDQELALSLDLDVHAWIGAMRVRAHLLRLMQSTSVGTGPEIVTAARGTLESLNALCDSAENGADSDPRCERDYRQRLDTTLRTWVTLMNQCAPRLVIPGGRLPYPTAAEGVDLRFQFPPRLLRLWARRARMIAAAVDANSMHRHVDADLVSVHPDSLDLRRHQQIVEVVVLASVLLQYNQGEPELQDEMAALADAVLPAALDPQSADLHPADRGPRAKLQQRLLPRALRMGRELAGRGISLALGRPERLTALQPMAASMTDSPLHHCFPLKLGPEQHLPFANLLTAPSFDTISSIF